MNEQSLFRIGRWQHHDRKQRSRYLPDQSLPPLVFDILYRGTSQAHALQRFLDENDAESISRWLDLIMWVDNTRSAYGGYVLYSGEEKAVLQVQFPRRDEHGCYLPGEDTQNLPTDQRIRMERERIAHNLAVQLREQLELEVAQTRTNQEEPS